MFVLHFTDSTDERAPEHNLQCNLKDAEKKEVTEKDGINFLSWNRLNWLNYETKKCVLRRYELHL
jgi:hypothetical protein